MVSQTKVVFHGIQKVVVCWTLQDVKGEVIGYREKLLPTIEEWGELGTLDD